MPGIPLLSPRRKGTFFATLLNLLLLLSFLPESTFAQTTISGRVTDAATGDPVVGAHILVKDTVRGAVSDGEGVFHLATGQSLPLTLEVTCVGYGTREVVLEKADTALDIRLEPQVLMGNDIIVTAQRREQAVQQVPISVSVLDQQVIKETPVLDRGGDLALYTPGLAGNDASATASYFTIRGIGSNAFGIGLESSVGIFVDDMYAGRVTAMTAFLDIERIEVIKGPQNTLFGRNASAGVISVISNKPQNEKALQLSIGLGNEGQKEATYTANYPLTSNFYARLAGRTSFRDGVRTVTNQDNQQIQKLDLIANRLSFLYRPDPNWAFHLYLEHHLDDSGGIGLLNTNTGNPFERDIELSAQLVEEKQFFGARLQIDRFFSENLYLKSISGLRSLRFDSFIDADASPVYIMNFFGPESSTTFLQDLRLIGQRPRLDWLIAGSFFAESIDKDVSFVFDDHAVSRMFDPISENSLGFDHPAFSLCDDVSEELLGPCLIQNREDIFSEGDYLSYALYGNFTYALTDNLNASVGLRYTVDDKKFESRVPPGMGITQWRLGDNLLGPNTGNTTITERERWRGLQPRLALDYSPRENIMAYINYARGYKAGGFNLITAIPFDEENSNAFEVGVKSGFANGAYKVNVSGYYIDYTDLQVQDFVNTLLVVDNAAAVESKGLEIETSASVQGGLSLMASASIGQARYRNYSVLVPDGSPNPVEADFSGNTPDRSPDHTFSVIARYKRSLGKVGDLVARVDYAYQSRVYYFSRENREDLSQEGYGLVNAYVSLEKLWNGRLDVSVYGSNLTDQNYLIHTGDPLGSGANAVRGVPRLVGIKLGLDL
ncbi:MAG TPA: TonB-dependent receptor [Kiloniellaceae bacterium]|nr:TonB-dependent receptor [Kiloniellaceae bacterium]